MATKHLIGSTVGPLVPIAGTLRNNNGVWEIINDAGHEPIGIDSVESTPNDITINYASLGAVEVGSLTVTPDEGYAQAGIFCGASVGLTQSVIRLGQAGRCYSDFVQYISGTGWVSSNGVFTCSFSNGVLTLTHPEIIDDGIFDVSVVARSGATGTYHATISSEADAVDGTKVKIEFRDAATGELMTANEPNFRAFVSHGGGSRPVNPQSLTTTKYPSSNLWISGWMRTT